MGFPKLITTGETSKLFILLGILERTIGSWIKLSKLINSIALLSKSVLFILGCGLRLHFPGDGLKILDSMISRTTKTFEKIYHDSNSDSNFHREDRLFWFIHKHEMDAGKI